MVVELGGSGHAAFECPRDVVGGHALQVGSQRFFAGFNQFAVHGVEGCVESGGDVGFGVAQADAFQCRTQSGEGFFGFEEEVTGDDNIAGQAVVNRAVDDDEFAAGYFALGLECACFCFRPCLSHCGPLPSVPAT